MIKNSMIKNFAWAAVTLGRPQRGRLILVSVLFLACALPPSLQPLLARGIVDRVVQQDVAISLWLLVGGMAASFLVPALLENFADLTEARLEERNLRLIDQMVIGAGAAMPDIAALEQPEVHDKISLLDRMVMEFARLPQRLLHVSAQIIGAITLLLSLGSLAWWLPLILLVAAIPHMAGEHRMVKIRFEVMRDQSRATREMDYCLSAASQPQLAKEVRAFGLGDFFLRRFDSRARPALAELGRLRLRSTVTAALGAAGYAVAVLICFAYIAWQASDGALGVGDIALYLTAVISLFGVLFTIGMQSAMVMEMLKSVDALRELVADARPGIQLSEDGAPAPERIQHDITLEGVRFAYQQQGEDAEVLRGLDLVIPANRVLALVGENGEGKSTLVKLLTRMYDPTAGRITLDATPLSGYDLNSLRSRIATVFQDHARFALTLGENIAIGSPELLRPDVSPGERETLVDAAVVKAGAEQVLAKQPNGLDTELTRQFGGVELSGGEWQRVATARAFLPDAALVILDEPTSALDVDAERRLFDTFADLVRGRTAIMISHRFSTVRTADVIAVLADGQIAEYGSHEELMAADGHYAELFGLQADRFRD